MRIISGTRRGHKLGSFDGRDVRPTTDRVKEAMFNIIAPFIPGSRVLDLFSGSGALALEAISRGAENACCVDKDIRSVGIIKRNVSSLGFDDACIVVHSAYDDFLKAAQGQYDMVFLDPPYNKGFIEPVLAALAQSNLLRAGGIVVLESDETDFHGDAEGFSVYRCRKYGRTYITVYTKAEGQSNENSSLSGQL